MKLRWPKSLQTERDSDPRKLWQVGQELRYTHGTTPTEKQIEFAKREWLLRFDIANYLGLSDKAIVDLAKEMHRRCINGTWETCDESVKAGYFNKILPELVSYESKYVITGPRETLLIAKLTNR